MSLQREGTFVPIDEGVTVKAENADQDDQEGEEVDQSVRLDDYFLRQ